MATRSGTVVKTQLDATAIVLEWTGLLANDDGAWLLLGHYADKSLHVTGTPSGATVRLQGSNEDTPTTPNAVNLSSPSETTIGVTATPALKQVLENPLYVRPLVSGGDGSTAITVRLVCRV